MWLSCWYGQIGNYSRNNSALDFCSWAHACRRFPRGRCYTWHLLEPLLPSQEKSRQFSNCVTLILSPLSSGSCHHPGISSTRPVAAESGVSPVPLRLSDLGWAYVLQISQFMQGCFSFIDSYQIGMLKWACGVYKCWRTGVTGWTFLQSLGTEKRFLYGWLMWTWLPTGESYGSSSHPVLQNWPRYPQTNEEIKNQSNWPFQIGVCMYIIWRFIKMQTFIQFWEGNSDSPSSEFLRRSQVMLLLVCGPLFE